MTPVPKVKGDLKTCEDVRKVASTSDYAKIFELFLREWISEDIGRKMDINQFAGRKGSGTEHMLVLMIDRILGLLDKPGMRAVVKASVLEVSGISRFSDRRLSRCLDFNIKCTQDENTSRFFPRNPNLDLTLEARNREEFIVNFSRTKQYQNSAIPFCQRLLNEYWPETE